MKSLTKKMNINKFLKIINIFRSHWDSNPDSQIQSLKCLPLHHETKYHLKDIFHLYVFLFICICIYMYFH
jgi:hypothetical protein